MGRLVRKPNMKDPRPEIAAVAVIRSRLMSMELAVLGLSRHTAGLPTNKTRRIVWVTGARWISGIGANTCPAGLRYNRCL